MSFPYYTSGHGDCAGVKQMSMAGSQPKRQASPAAATTTLSFTSVAASINSSFGEADTLKTKTEAFCSNGHLISRLYICHRVRFCCCSDQRPYCDPRDSSRVKVRSGQLKVVSKRSRKPIIMYPPFRQTYIPTAPFCIHVYCRSPYYISLSLTHSGKQDFTLFIWKKKWTG